MKRAINKNKIYITTILLALLIVWLFFMMQVLFVLKSFKLYYAVVPTLLGITLGVLIGKIQILRKKLQNQERLFHTIADEAREFSYFRTLDGTYEYVSPAVENITGYTQDDFYKNKNFLTSLISPKDKEAWLCHFEDINITEHLHKTIELRIVHKDGHEVWISHSCSTIYEDNKKVGVRSVNSDITKRKADEKAILELSIYDKLTTLPNRHKIFETLHSLTDEQTPFSILFLDLNRFKKINDNLGHKVGDKILKQVANNLKGCSDSNSFVGRLGGDEFIVILKNKTLKEEINLHVEYLYSLIEHDYHINDFTFFIGLSIGIASYPKDSTHIEDLMACADKAMNKAKSIHSTNTVYYSDMITDYKFDDFLLEKDLRDAINNKDLMIYLQPKYDTAKNEIHSYEALIRWEKNGKFISPAVFIPVAEDTGLINDITDFVLEETFKLAKKWHDSGKEPYKISINVSMIDFVSGKFVSGIRKKLEDFDAKAEWFELEMTESIFLDKSEKIEQKIQSLIQMGFGIALDDFGTGYSSLSYLTRFPIDTLKIDKSFIDNLATDYNKAFALLKSILAIANDLELSIVIEGVETQDQLNIINSLGLYIIQGYFFYKPMPVNEIEILAS